MYLGTGGRADRLGAGSPRRRRRRAAALERSQEIERKQREIERKKAVIEAQIAALRTEFETEKDELERAIARERLHQKTIAEATLALAWSRKSDDLAPKKESAAKNVKRGRK